MSTEVIRLKTNYQLLTDAVIKSLGAARPRLLLHSCCGPCSSYSLEYLTQHFDVSVFFYNPNIQPEAEYVRRLATQRQLIAALCPGVELLDDGYGGESFTEAARGLEGEPEGGARCVRCFELRLERTAEKAAGLGFEWCGTTLTISPHKNAELINSIGTAAAEKYGVRWLPADLKKRGGYQRSIELSNSFHLYRQNYCGCLYSAAPRAGAGGGPDA